jgi:hypothetical protein
MKAYVSGSLLLLFLFFVPAIHAKTTPESLARTVLSEDPRESAAAIAELREAGPEGLRVLLQLYQSEIDAQAAGDSASPRWQRLSAALDAVSQQKDSYLSGLYWYTDLERAKEAARATGKPILSLRLLGNLSDEFSCANSRFFRTVLYSNAAVSKVLRDEFILHWKSVRPAPKVTIDFGDGRKLQGTITGNSIHYVLGADGQILDALPGLYGPQAFLRSLAGVQELHERLKGLNLAARAGLLNEYHRAEIKSLTSKWLNDAQLAGGKIPESLIPGTKPKGTPRAIEIAPLAVTKMVTEIDILRAITRDSDELGKVTDQATWIKIAVQLPHLQDAKLDDRSISLIRRQTESLLAAADGTGRTPEVKLNDLVQKLWLSIALDTVRNEYMLHTKLHAWLTAAWTRNDLDRFNEKVYAELFLTPKTDPWFGLFSAETYMALERGGVSP